MSTDIPDGIPILSRGSHDPGKGACLMEATALLAGEPHGDHPACTHPLIAAVARIVNDACGDPARQRLLRLAPAAAETATDDPRVTDELVLLVCGRALPVALPIWAPALRRALRQARHRRRRGHPPLTRWQQRRADAAVRYAAASLVLASTSDRDRHLVTLLADCLATAQHLNADRHPRTTGVAIGRMDAPRQVAHRSPQSVQDCRPRPRRACVSHGSQSR